MTMLKFTIVLTSIALVTGDPKNFQDYKVYRVTPTTDEQTSILHYIASNVEEYNFWTAPSHTNVSADVMVAPEQTEEFEKLMNLTETTYALLIENVQDLIDDENPPTPRTQTFGNYDWNRYYRLEEINSYLAKMANTYPAYVKLVVGGKSYEGRQILGVKVSFGPDNPAVFLEGGIHAREWISPATVTYILNELLTSKNSQVRALAESNDWYVFPVFNPDGYVYSHTTHRLWRKTRTPYSPVCRGADLNRNWGYKWKADNPTGAACGETYAGSAAFSDIESRSLSKYITSISENLYAYISFHAYSQLLLFPHGYTRERPVGYGTMSSIAKKTIASLAKRYGTVYGTGSIAETVYVATGSSLDWVKGTLDIPLAYCYELRDKGRNGFLLPAKQIVPTGEETLDSLVGLFKEALTYGIPFKKKKNV